jgi:hypothetical protein
MRKQRKHGRYLKHVRYLKTCRGEVDIGDLLFNVESLWIDLTIAQNEDEHDPPAISLDDVHEVLEGCRDVLTEVIYERWAPLPKRTLKRKRKAER